MKITFDTNNESQTRIVRDYLMCVERIAHFRGEVAKEENLDDMQYLGERLGWWCSEFNKVTEEIKGL